MIAHRGSVFCDAYFRTWSRHVATETKAEQLPVKLNWDSRRTSKIELSSSIGRGLGTGRTRFANIWAVKPASSEKGVYEVESQTRNARWQVLMSIGEGLLGT